MIRVCLFSFFILNFWSLKAHASICNVQECFAQGLVMEAIEVAKTKVSDSFPSHHFSDTLTTTEQSGLVPGIWLVHCCVVALICFGFLVYRNYNVKRKNQRELILLRAEKEKQKVQCDLLEKEVEWKSEQLSRLSIGLERQMNFGEKMLDLTRSLTTISPSEKRDLILKIKDEQRIDDSTTAIYDMVRQLNAKVFVNLLNRHPELSDNDQKLCGFILMGLTNKEIGIVKSITTASVKLAKNRLRKKLNLESGVDLRKYLTDLCKPLEIRA